MPYKLHLLVHDLGLGLEVRNSLVADAASRHPSSVTMRGAQRALREKGARFGEELPPLRRLWRVRDEPQNAKRALPGVGCNKRAKKRERERQRETESPERDRARGGDRKLPVIWRDFPVPACLHGLRT